MSVCYSCHRCSDFQSVYFNDMRKHLTRKHACRRAGESLLYSDDEILVLSLSPSYDDIHSLENDNLSHLKDSNIMNTNKKELLEELDNIEKSKNKDCKYCNVSFGLIMDLKKHVISTCFYNELMKRKTEKEKAEQITNIANTNNHSDISKSYNTINGDNNYNTTNNTNNTTNNNNNITNNVNIYLEMKNPVPFDNDWDISQISDDKKSKFIISNKMYSKLLEEILKNEINLNVIIDKENESGMVYKNDIDKYINMKSKDIIASTMDKLKSQLLDINISLKDDDFDIMDEISVHARRMITKKHIDYGKDKNIQEDVNHIMSDIYDTRKEDAKNLAKSVLDAVTKSKLKSKSSNSTNKDEKKDNSGKKPYVRKTNVVY